MGGNVGGGREISGWACAVALAGCAPQLTTPQAEHRAADITLATQLTHQLDALPAVAHAALVVHRAWVDPIDPARSAPDAFASAVLTLAPGADARAITAAAEQILAAAVPTVRRNVIVVPTPAVTTPTPAAPLRSLLIAALLTIGALAGWLAWLERQRRGISAQ